jgi:hypothetical protein
LQGDQVVLIPHQGQLTAAWVLALLQDRRGEMGGQVDQVAMFDLKRDGAMACTLKNQATLCSVDHREL